MFLCIVLFAAGFSSARFYYLRGSAKLSTVRTGQSGLTNALLGCEISSENSNGKMDNIKSSLESYISRALRDQEAKRISVYLRSLNDSAWIGINENEKYSPASLLKVAEAIVSFKKAESDPDYLSKKLVYTAEDDKQLSEPDQRLKVGQAYSVEGLISLMLTKSSNPALNVLERELGGQYLQELYNHIKAYSMDIGDPRSDSVSPKNYAWLFRFLYSATYLDRDSSEKVLQILSKSDFPDGIRKQIPSDIIVADKFGARIFGPEHGVVDTGNKELHDCGIVYFPNSPYFICVMTSGVNFDSLKGVISDTSKIAFDGFSKAYAR